MLTNKFEENGSLSSEEEEEERKSLFSGHWIHSGLTFDVGVAAKLLWCALVVHIGAAVRAP